MAWGDVERLLEERSQAGDVEGLEGMKGQAKSQGFNMDGLIDPYIGRARIVRARASKKPSDFRNRAGYERWYNDAGGQSNTFESIIQSRVGWGNSWEKHNSENNMMKKVVLPGLAVGAAAAAAAATGGAAAGLSFAAPGAAAAGSGATLVAGSAGAAKLSVAGAAAASSALSAAGTAAAVAGAGLGYYSAMKPKGSEGEESNEVGNKTPGYRSATEIEAERESGELEAQRGTRNMSAAAAGGAGTTYVSTTKGENRLRDLVKEGIGEDVGMGEH